MYFNVKLDPGAIMPSKAYVTDAGFDVYSREDAVIYAKSSQMFDTGVHIEIPPGIAGFLKSKSGLNCKYSITSDGVIDSGYSGSIIVKLYNHSNDDYQIKKGDKISQIVFIPIPPITLREKDYINNNTARGDHGFGSSGR